MKYAWIEGDRVRDISPGQPAAYYAPEIAKFYSTLVPDDAENGDGWVDGQLVKPVPPPPPEPVPEPVVYPQVTRVQFKMLFTSAERIAIKEARATDAILDDFYELLEDPQLTYVDLSLQSNQDAINYLASKGYITPERIPEILSGQLQ